MADISTIITPDGTSYNIKDETAREHGIYYGTCGTAAATAAKVATVTGVTELKTGLTIAVKFTYANTIANPTLNVNSLGAKAIKRYGTTAPSTSAASSWNANSVITLTYDGSYWQMHDWNNTTYSALNDADMKAGTATASRLITAVRLKDAVEYHAPVTSVNGDTGDVTVDVPTKVSELTNDSGYITGYTETDPTVPSWAKQSAKPSYTASEVGAVPTTRKVNGKALSADITLSASDVGALASETDPVFTTSAAYGISSNDILHWDNAATLNAGSNSYPIISVEKVSVQGISGVQAVYDDGSSDGLILFFADGVGLTTVKSAIEAQIPTNVSDLNNDAGYITGYTETDPIFTASPAHGITSANITDWNTAITTANTALSGVNGSYIYDQSFTISNGVATFTPHVYLKGQEVTTNYAASCFTWKYRLIDGSEVNLTTKSDRGCDVTISTMGYGGHVIGSFTPPE